MAKTNIDPEQPDWVCNPCGARLGRNINRGILSTYHCGKCGVCGKPDVFVTEPRDFGYLRQGWKEEAARA